MLQEKWGGGVTTFIIWLHRLGTMNVLNVAHVLIFFKGAICRNWIPVQIHTHNKQEAAYHQSNR